MSRTRSRPAAVVVSVTTMVIAAALLAPGLQCGSREAPSASGTSLMPGSILAIAPAGGSASTGGPSAGMLVGALAPDGGGTDGGGTDGGGDGGTDGGGGSVVGSCNDPSAGLCAEILTAPALFGAATQQGLAQICRNEGGSFSTQPCSTPTFRGDGGVPGAGECTIQDGPFTLGIFFASPPFDLASAQLYCARRQGTWSPL